MMLTCRTLPKLESWRVGSPPGVPSSVVGVATATKCEISRKVLDQT